MDIVFAEISQLSTRQVTDVAGRKNAGILIEVHGVHETVSYSTVVDLILRTE